MSTPTPPTNPPRGRWGIILLAVVAAAVIVGLIGWKVYRGQRPNEIDLDALCRANNRGIGLMEQYQYEQAVAAFEEVVRIAPDWRPGKINLGIALFNASGKPLVDP